MVEATGSDWLARSRTRLAQLDLSPVSEITGRVMHVADGIAFISGLPEAQLNELLHCETGQTGLVLTLEQDAIGMVLLDDAEGIEAGDRVSGTGEILRVPVGPGLLGRIVDPLGRPLDQDEPIIAESYQPVERAAPPIIDRDLVRDPVETGVLVVDALFALGRGQRELIIGDRATGKTSLAVEAMINQKNSDIVCVYVAVGQRATALERVIEAVRAHGAPERTIFVVASAAMPPGLAVDAGRAGAAFRFAGSEDHGFGEPV